MEEAIVLGAVVGIATAAAWLMRKALLELESAFRMSNGEDADQ